MGSGRSIALYDSSNISQFDCALSGAAEAVREYFAPLISAGSREYVANTDAAMALVDIDGCLVPITINQGPYTEQSFVASPYNHFITYFKEELDRIRYPIIKWFLKSTVSLAGWFAKHALIDRVIVVNNWLLSTNPGLAIDCEQAGRLTAFLTDRFPNHAIVFRNMDDKLSAPLRDCLKRTGYRMIVGRLVFIIDIAQGKYLKRNDHKIDQALLRKTDLIQGDKASIADDDLARLLALYDQLYLDKYSKNNPNYTLKYFKHLLSCRLPEFVCFRYGQDIASFGMWILLNDVLYASLAGYDLSQPRRLGAYRAIMAAEVAESVGRAAFFHLSAGAGKFKRLRGAEPVLEYYAIHDRHLPVWRRLPWAILAVFFNGMAGILAMLNRLKLIRPNVV
ncbi:MAG: hypothetical protein WC474_01915 [Hydrogenophilaceae bacterium]